MLGLAWAWRLGRSLKKIGFDRSPDPFMFGLTCLFESEELGLANQTHT
jgi:hypothetical protein